MVMKKIYTCIDNGAKNALKYVFQMNEKENKVKTTNFKILHHQIRACYALQPIYEYIFKLTITHYKHLLSGVQNRYIPSNFDFEY